MKRKVASFIACSLLIVTMSACSKKENNQITDIAVSEQTSLNELNPEDEDKITTALADYLSTSTLLDNYIGNVGRLIKSGLNQNSISKINELTTDLSESKMNEANEKTQIGVEELNELVDNKSELDRLFSSQTELIEQALSWRELLLNLNESNSAEIEAALKEKGPEYVKANKSLQESEIEYLQSFTDNKDEAYQLFVKSNQKSMKEFGDSEDYNTVFGSVK